MGNQHLNSTVLHQCRLLCKHRSHWTVITITSSSWIWNFEIKRNAHTNQGKHEQKSSDSHLYVINGSKLSVEERGQRGGGEESIRRQDLFDRIRFPDWQKWRRFILFLSFYIYIFFFFEIERANWQKLCANDWFLIQVHITTASIQSVLMETQKESFWFYWGDFRSIVCQIESWRNEVALTGWSNGLELIFLIIFFFFSFV